MSEVDQSHEHYEEILREHQELLGSLKRIGDAIAERRRGKSGLPEMFIELSSHLTTHFAYESEGGYMNEAIQVAPQLKGKADELERRRVDGT